VFRYVPHRLLNYHLGVNQRLPSNTKVFVSGLSITPLKTGLELASCANSVMQEFSFQLSVSVPVSQSAGVENRACKTRFTPAVLIGLGLISRQ